MSQEKINKVVNKIIKIFIERKERAKEWTKGEMTETDTYVIDLKTCFAFYNDVTKYIYTGNPIKYKYKPLSNMTIDSSSTKNYIVGFEDNNYTLYRLRTLEDLEQLLEKIKEDDQV